jgi:hypothetical protein
MKNHSLKSLLFACFVATLGLSTACQKNEAETTPVDSNNGNNNTGTALSASAMLTLYKKIYGATDVYLDGNFVVVKTKNFPDHKSPYFLGTAWESSKYEAYNGSNTRFALNPNRIAEKNFSLRFPVNPQEAQSKSATPLGPIGIALNGVVFFNQYAPGSQPLTNEINSFDQYNAHPAPGNEYHYHIEPNYLTNKLGKNVLLGFLLDGFPVYGPLENGKTITSADLDAYHGHKHATTEFPDGIYHYHFTNDAPYLNGSGFFGTPGTISR